MSAIIHALCLCRNVGFIHSWGTWMVTGTQNTLPEAINTCYCVLEKTQNTEAEGLGSPLCCILSPSLTSCVTLGSLLNPAVLQIPHLQNGDSDRLLRVPWTARRSNQSILKEINLEYSLEGLMQKLQYFGHLMRRAESLEKTLMLGKIQNHCRW